MLTKTSEIQITPVKPQNGLVAFASFVFDSSLYLGSIAIVTRPQGGYRLVYPTKKVSDKEFNIFYPINKDIAQSIELAVVKKFEEVTNAHDRHYKTSLT